MRYICLFIGTILFFISLTAESIGEPLNPAKEQLADTAQVDREYTLEAVITGYTGVGGEIDGIRNPVLQAQKGETVRITMVNGETLTHDIVMEKMGIKSEAIIEEGASTSITFEATSDDTYFCSIPGHRQAGMEGQFEIIKSTGQDFSQKDSAGEGTVPTKDGQPVNLDFEYATLDGWTSEGEA